MEPAEDLNAQQAPVFTEYEVEDEPLDEEDKGDGEQSSFGNVFPQEQLQNGWNTAWGFMVAGYNQAKVTTIQGIDYVSNSEAMGKVRSQMEAINNSDEMKKIREKSAEAGASIKAASEPILAKVVEGINKTGTVIHEKTTEGLQLLEPQLKQAQDSMRAGLSTVSRNVQAGFEEIRTASSSSSPSVVPENQPMNL